MRTLEYPGVARHSKAQPFAVQSKVSSTVAHSLALRSVFFLGVTFEENPGACVLKLGLEMHWRGILV